MSPQLGITYLLSGPSAADACMTLKTSAPRNSVVFMSLPHWWPVGEPGGRRAIDRFSSNTGHLSIPAAAEFTRQLFKLGSRSPALRVFGAFPKGAVSVGLRLCGYSCCVYRLRDITPLLAGSTATRVCVSVDLNIDSHRNNDTDQMKLILGPNREWREALNINVKAGSHAVRNRRTP